MENNTTLDFQTFQKYMDGFFSSKFNQLSYSNRSYPKRMEKITVNLATAPSNARKVNVPFKSCLVSRIYSTATPTTDKAGTIKILFDYDNTMNVANAVSLFPNDSFVMDTTASGAYLTWDAQTDTSVDLYFFVDIDYRAGTTKTQIVGTVSVQNTSATSLFVKETPDLITRLARTSAGNASYTVRSGYRAKVYYSCSGGGTGAMRLTIGGTVCYDSQNALPASLNITGETEAMAGEIVRIDQTSGSIDWIFCQIVEYAI